MHGTYVRGWKFDWQEAARDTQRYLDSGRKMMAAACADPGVVGCPQCGEHHWREFEVFLCCRCGAEVEIVQTKTNSFVKAGPPERPERCRPHLADGMRVRYVGKEVTGTDGERKRLDGMWPAGRIKPGECGTVREDGEFAGRVGWRIEFDGRIPKGDYAWGLFGPFLDDTLEVIESA